MIRYLELLLVPVLLCGAMLSCDDDGGDNINHYAQYAGSYELAPGGAVVFDVATSTPEQLFAETELTYGEVVAAVNAAGSALSGMIPAEGGPVMMLKDNGDFQLGIPAEDGSYQALIEPGKARYRVADGYMTIHVDKALIAALATPSAEPDGRAEQGGDQQPSQEQMILMFANIVILAAEDGFLTADNNDYIFKVLYTRDENGMTLSADNNLVGTTVSELNKGIGVLVNAVKVWGQFGTEVPEEVIAMLEMVQSYAKLGVEFAESLTKADFSTGFVISDRVVSDYVAARG